MKASDLQTASRLTAERALNVKMRERLAASEALTLSIGEGGNASEIVLGRSYLAEIRRDLIIAFDLRIAANDKALAALGVETDG